MASRIAEAYVQVVPRIDGVAGKLNSQLSGELGKAGAAGGTSLANGVGKGLGGKLKSLVGPALLAGTAAATIGLAKFAGSSVDAARESAVVDAKLSQIATSMNTFGDSTGAVVQRLKDVASQEMMNLGVDDEVIKSTQAKLFTFKELAATADVTGGAFDRATTAAFDLASAGFGSAETNAVQLGKALQDPIKGMAALGRSGVTFTDAEKERIKALVESNQMGEAQNLVLAAIENQVGGTAAATTTASDKMKLAFGELQEEVGAALLPAFDQLATALVPIVQQLAPVLAKVFGALAPVITTIAGVLPSLVESLLPVASVLTGLVEIIAEIAAVVLPIFVEILLELMPIVEELLPLFMEILRALLPLVPVALGLIKAFLPIIMQILPPLISLIQALIPVVKFLIDVFVAIAIPVIQFLATVLGFLVEKVAGVIKWFVEAGTAIAKGIGDMGKTIFKFFKELPGVILGFFKGAATWLFNIGGDIVRGLINGLKAVGGTIGKMFLDILPGWIKEPFKKALGIASPSKVFKEFGKNIGEGLVQGLLAGESSITSTMEKVAGWVTKSFEDGLISKKSMKAANRLIGAYTKNLLSLQKDLDAVNEQLGAAQDVLADRIQERLEYINGLTKQFGAELKIDEQTTASSAIQYLKDRIAKTQELAKLSKQLIEMGLNKDLYKQIIEAGAVDFAASIIEGGQAAVDELNVLSSEANAAALELATDVGDVLFNEGIAFAQAVVDGLLSQKSLIEEMMANIAEAFAIELNALIQAALLAMKGLKDASDSAGKSANKAATTVAKTVAKTGDKKTVALTPTQQAALNKANKMLAADIAKESTKSAVQQGILNKLKLMPFAKGGYVSGPTPALIGEAGPEVVVPLNKFEKWMGLGNGSGKTVNYYAAPNNSIDSEKALLQAMRRSAVVSGW